MRAAPFIHPKAKNPDARLSGCAIRLWGKTDLDVKSRPFSSIGEMTITAIVLESKCVLRLIQYRAQR